jgi:hypothetical protein
MSAKIIEPTIFINGALLDGAFTSQPMDVSRLIYASIILTVTGDPTGDLRLQVQNGDSLWATTTNTRALTGISQTVVMELNICPWEKIRLIYVRTSGTGTLTATFFAKGW